MLGECRLQETAPRSGCMLEPPSSPSSTCRPAETSSALRAEHISGAGEAHDSDEDFEGGLGAMFGD